MEDQKQYNYEIISRRLDPPVDGLYPWASHVRFRGEAPNHNFTEMHGETERGAAERMRQHVEQVIDRVRRP